jgi:ribosome biogenesis GTPase
LKQGARQGDVASIGDQVEIQKLDSETGVIDKVYPRQRALVRVAPTPRGSYRQIIIANPDQAVFVFACRQPEPKLGMLDRFLVTAEKQGIPAMIVANKIDLLGEGEMLPFAFYEQIGYPVCGLSARFGSGLAELHQRLHGKLSVFAGPSGTGKSTLLNTLIPRLNITTSEVSQSTQKGRHTTVARELYSLPGGGYLADSPGLKALALWDVEPQELDGYFPEIRHLVRDCQFNDCTHLHEPGCAVLAALEEGRIVASRYRSYVNMRVSQEEPE